MSEKQESHVEPVRLAVPAQREFVVLVRSAAAHLGLRCGMAVMDVADFRLAVDEACSLFLADETAGGATGGATLICEFTESEGALAVTVSAPVRGDFATAQVGTFGWTLLQSLVDELWWSADMGCVEVRLAKRCDGASVPESPVTSIV